MSIPKYAITHAGVFHADDVFATAFLKKINPKIKWYRTNDPEKQANFLMNHFGIKESDIIIYDVGGGKFDHHQQETIEYRYPNSSSLPYSSFGKVVREFYPLIMTDEMYKIFDKDIVIPIDFHDCNGRLQHGDRNELSNAIFLFNPNWNEEDADRDQLFGMAVEFASTIIDRCIRKCEATILSEDIVNKGLSLPSASRGYLVLDHYVNYGGYMAAHPYIRWAIYPSMRGGYQVFSCGDKNHRNRDIFSKEEIEELSNMDSCIFVHPVGFTASFKTMDDAIKYIDRICMRQPIVIDKT